VFSSTLKGALHPLLSLVLFSFISQAANLAIFWLSVSPVKGNRKLVPLAPANVVGKTNLRCNAVRRNHRRICNRFALYQDVYWWLLIQSSAVLLHIKQCVDDLVHLVDFSYSTPFSVRYFAAAFRCRPSQTLASLNDEQPQTAAFFVPHHEHWLEHNQRRWAINRTTTRLLFTKASRTYRNTHDFTVRFIFGPRIGSTPWTLIWMGKTGFFTL